MPNRLPVRKNIRVHYPLHSREVQAIKNHQEDRLRILLFVKKSDGERTDFYCMGDMEPIEYEQMSIKNDKGQDLPMVNINFSMKNTVEDHLYRYFEED